MKLQIEPLIQEGFPATITFNEELSSDAFMEWYEENKETYDHLLLSSGAILLRGLNINAAPKFQQLMESLYPNPKSFLDGNSTRGKYTSNVYNASEYDAGTIIQLHTEYSYSNIWPAIICFSCVTAPDHGGQTTVGDCRKIISLLDDKIVDEFEKKGITYIRNLHDGSGLGPSWMEAFETDDKEVVEQYCSQNDMQITWGPNNSLKIIQTRPAIRRHPVTGDKLWFNQVDQFYPKIYGDEVYLTLLSMVDDDEEALPMSSRYGDGSEIQKEYIEKIIEALEKVTVPINWQVGDLAIVDNMLSLHGRLPYKGNRKILVSMA